jgi:hypothetical protein
VALKSSVLATALVGSMLAASADDIDMTKVRCKDFLSSPKDRIAIILAWLEGYYTKESDPPIIFSDKMVKDAKNLSAYCNDHGDDDIVHAADRVMPVE